ncbi:DUF1428 domain-containing protein [Jiella sonneratiae]|uniref:DUF1428 domain-containing protein n=1 Tax=Jiella sonneratiae TaxID=2816856 RepID=A0ABS3JB68_9HYPH|nr:DUF1428 domain-containing protein [Jiella sonneratiae]MBO0906203.1 DUF1428 domain-containing protein [Jiella sonneratiae]
MSFILGHVIAVPTENREAFRKHAATAAEIMTDFGASRTVDLWGDDVPDGKINDFKGAVAATPDETVTFGWMEFPDKATADAAVEKMMSDPRMQALRNMPFDGSRMIYGAFEAIFEEGEAVDGGYVDGFVIPVPADKREAYHTLAATSWPIFRDHGAKRQVECWGTDVPRGKVTDFFRAAHAKDGENIAFAFLEWPDRQTRDAGMKAIVEDTRMNLTPSEMPFDGKRMIYAGFETI